jgi:hypothetical protein
MKVDQLLAIVSDLSMFTTKEQLEDRVSQCQATYDQLKGSGATSNTADAEKASMLLAAIARMQNKMVAIEFARRREAQRAIKAAANIPRESFSTIGQRAH